MKLFLALLLALTIPLTTLAARQELAPDLGEPGGGEIPPPNPVAETPPAPTPVTEPPPPSPAPTTVPTTSPQITALPDPIPTAVYNPAAAIQYVQAHGASSPEWAALALVAANASVSGINPSTSTTGSATDLARRILAVAAVGEDPTALANALETKLVNGNIGGNTFVNDDVFALLAFRAAGWSTSNSTVQAITNFLKNAQRSDGGWGVTTASQSDVDSTSAALQAMKSVGASSALLTHGLTYLHSQQRSDGGFPFRLPSTSNSASTAWALTALNALNESLGDWMQNGASPQDFLTTCQRPDGGFGFAPGDTTSTILLSSYSLLALSGDGFIVRTFTPPPSPAPEPTPDPVPTPTTNPVAGESNPPTNSTTAVVVAPSKLGANQNTNTQPERAVQVLGATTLPVTGSSWPVWVHVVFGSALFTLGLGLLLGSRHQTPAIELTWRH